MTGVLLSFPKFRAFTQSGTLIPLAGGKLYSYLAGTSTPQATYTDSSLGVPNANPVILDAAGQADVWLGGVNYKLTLTDSLGNIQWVEDNITSGVGGWEVGLAATQAQLAAIADSGTLSNDKKPDVVIDAHYVRTVNELARQRFKQQLLNDILVDLMICEIEGWDKLEYIRELKNLINSIGSK